MLLDAVVARVVDVDLAEVNRDVRWAAELVVARTVRPKRRYLLKGVFVAKL
jgi:hypothetical protein